MSLARVLGRHCMNHMCLLVLQICWRPPGRGYLPREGAGGQPPTAGTGGWAEGLQHLGEHPLSAGLPRVHWWHGESHRHPSFRSPCHSSRGGASCASRWSTETPMARGPGHLHQPCLCMSTLSDVVGPTLTMPVKCSVAVSGPWSLW